MALSSIHDVGTHGHAVNHQNTLNHHHHHLHHHHLPHALIGDEKHFRPNPDAKPFIPNPIAIAAANFQFVKDKNINNVVPRFWINPNGEHPENLVIAPPPSGANLLKKQHIAFHLVSNLLDEELPEEKDRDINAGFPNSPRMNIYDQSMEHVQGWQTTTEPLNLPLEMVKANAENKSINNKSIHEIWSPDPSPNGLSSVSPTEEINPYVGNQQQQQNSQSTSPDNSFDQSSATEMESGDQQVPQQLPPQAYSTNVYEDTEGVANPEPTSPSQMYYPPPPIIHQPYVYRGMGPSGAHRVPPPEMYPVHPGREGMMTRPVIYGPGYYGPQGPPQHNRYPPSHHHSNEEMRYRPRYHNNHHNNRYHHHNSHYHGNHHHHHEVSYETKMSFLEELSIGLDECRDQLRHLERDYKKADVTLSRDFRLRKSSMGDTSSSKYPPNSTRVDKLIADQMREHQKIESLIGRIERLGFTPMHPNVGVTLDSWLAAIKDLRNARKNEVANMMDTPGVQYGSKSHSQADVSNLIKTMKEVNKFTRSARTVVWCAMQMLYANCTTSSPSGG